MQRDTSASEGVWRFLAPDPAAFVSGGNVYNRRLLEHVEGLRLTRPEELDSVEGSPILCDSMMMAIGASLPGKTPKVLLVHHLESLDALSAAPREKALLKAFDAFVATSEFTRAKLEELGAGEKAILVLPPGLSFDPQGRKWDFRPKEAFKGLIVANWIPRKGLLEFFESLARELDPTDDFVLEIAGDPTIDPAHGRAVESFLASRPSLARRIRRLGVLGPKALCDAYMRADCLVSAARVETFGMAIQDALALGLPVLARSGGYVEALLANGRGELFSDVESLARRFLALARDPAERARLPRARRADALSWKEIGARLSRFLKDLEETR